MIPLYKIQNESKWTYAVKLGVLGILGQGEG